MGVSSLHMTFNRREEWEELRQHGFLQRCGIQYHWENQGYATFDHFLQDLKQSKRKNIRQVPWRAPCPSPLPASASAQRGDSPYDSSFPKEVITRCAKDSEFYPLRRSSGKISYIGSRSSAAGIEPATSAVRARNSCTESAYAGIPKSLFLDTPYSLDVVGVSWNAVGIRRLALRLWKNAHPLLLWLFFLCSACQENFFAQKAQLLLLKGFFPEGCAGTAVEARSYCWI